MQRDVSTFIQYLILVAVAGWLAFYLGLASVLRGSDPGVSINIREAWNNFSPLWRDWLTVFAVLGVGRLLLVALLRWAEKRFGPVKAD